MKQIEDLLHVTKEQKPLGEYIESLSNEDLNAEYMYQYHILGEILDKYDNKIASLDTAPSWYTKWKLDEIKIEIADLAHKKYCLERFLTSLSIEKSIRTKGDEQ